MKVLEIKKQNRPLPKSNTDCILNCFVINPTKLFNEEIQRHLLFSGAGGLDEDSFAKSFEEVKHVNIFSGRALSEEIAKIKETLSKSSNDWKSRVDALQMVRSLILAGALNFDEMHNSLRTLDVPFQVSIKDLRSQVRLLCLAMPYHLDHPSSLACYYLCRLYERLA